MIFAMGTQVWHVSFPEDTQYSSDSASLKVHVSAASYSPEPSLFYNLFPFHVLLDGELNIQQVK